MNWQHFQTYNEASTRAFEAMCNQLFELWINRTYVDEKKSFVVVNGAGGDGGVEAYATLVDGSEAKLQPIWIVRVLKEVSTKAGEKFEFFADRDETYLVWKNNKQWKTKLLRLLRN